MLDTLIVGLDGVPFEYLTPLINRGRIPHIANEIKTGRSFPLNTVYPPMTPVAWPSFATGKNPGKHGIFGWWRLHLVGDSVVNLPTTSSNVSAKAFWHYLSDQGNQVGVINVPMTKVPKKFNGVVLPGFDNPFADENLPEDFGYPNGIVGDLRAQGIDYRVLGHLAPPDELLTTEKLQSMLDSWKEVELERTKAALWIAKHYNLDCLVIVFHMVDYFLHRVRPDSKVATGAIETLDQCIGELLKVCEHTTTKIIMSDHGSIEVKKYIFLQNWLIQHKLLTFNDCVAESNLRIIVRIWLQKNIKEIELAQIDEITAIVLEKWSTLSEVSRRSFSNAIMRVFPTANMADDNVDWSQTKAYTNSSYGEISINVEGREPKGIVKTQEEYNEIVRYIIENLEEMSDPHTGELVNEKVVKREEYYSGHKLHAAPDILCFLRDPSYYFMRYNAEMRPSTTFNFLKHDSDVFISAVSDQDDYLGDHTPTGIFIANGFRVTNKNTDNSPQITDIAPTVLRLFGLNAPLGMDGQPLADVFDFPGVTRELIDETRPEASGRERDTEDEQTVMLKERLRALGYNI